MRCVGIGGGSSVKDAEEGCVLWSVYKFIRRSALLGMVHKRESAVELALEVHRNDCIDFCVVQI